MEKNKPLKEESPYLFVRHEAAIDRACKRAVREALLMHKRANNPIAVWQDGKVAIIEPEDIVFE